MIEISKRPYSAEIMQEQLQQVRHLLDRLASVPPVTSQQEISLAERLDDAPPRKPRLDELRDKLNKLHPADLAFILEALPVEQRFLAWGQVETDRAGDILIEVSDAVRKSLIATMNSDALRKTTEQLDMNKIAGLAPYLPQSVMRDVFKSLTIEEREQLRAAISYPPNAVGALMNFDMVTIREGATLEAVSRFLRRLDTLPDHTDQLFVVDRDGQFKGVLSLNQLLVNEPEVEASTLIASNSITFRPDDEAQQAAQVFERYGLISAPVLDEEGKLLGRITVNTVIDFIRAQSESDLLNLAGLHEQEDIFASVWKSAQNRWLWLMLNLCTAFFASRVIGSFENTIEKLVALATLMPIVVMIAGNSGSQTSAIFIRAFALGQISPNNVRRFLGRELVVSLLNGLIWGSIAGGFAYLLYQSVPLGLVMMSAMLFSLLLGALAGMLIPLAMQKFGLAPTFGSGILLTAITSCGGFFIFLGLATAFLIH